MIRNLIITLILILAVAGITVKYFKNLNPPGKRSGKVMTDIPADAALIFEYKNDGSFYDIFKGNTLLSTLIGDVRTNELTDLKTHLLDNPQLKPLFDGSSIFISLHPQSGSDNLDFLITATGNDKLSGYVEALAKRPDSSGMIIHDLKIGGKPGFNIYLNSTKRSLYLITDGDNNVSASFSKALVEASVLYRDKKHENVFVQLSDQQNANSIANLYVNYLQLSPLFDKMFKNTNTDIFRSFRQLNSGGALTLNYKTDALMFNGISKVDGADTKSYLSLFRYQQPEQNELKDIFPATTAYSINFAVSDAVKFENNLFQWQIQNGYSTEKGQVFSRIKKETGVELTKAFMDALGTEFAVITTKYQEKIALVKIKNGLKFRPYMVNISKMLNDDVGQFNYDKIPFYLLGEAFSIFRRPYFMIVDNYLMICNSQEGLSGYYNNYTKGNLLSHNEEYRRFDNLQAERSNVSFFVHFKNAGQLLKTDLKPEYAMAFAADKTGWNNYYAAAYQFTASENNFYTNFYMRVNMPDSLKVARMDTAAVAVSQP
ncbi:hypothetical protein KXQ82_09360 [Mucilaginibacter sp. HMF5004]|uniref:hypothetical protein n=1 Tax=Mucilaginibacter rivuli TaxID=2857527 RepID=UPI001C5D9385|nr:hypothetical protein [Mucilaginibacter rivuli]MBW4889924.1 hypothetical protein [Mucilaginibacter rivuli]